MTRREPQNRRRPLAAMLCCAFAACTLFASAAQAAPADDEDELPDARLMGYGNNISVSVDGGTAMSYFMTAILGGLTVGILFKSSGRTHLD